MADSGAQLPTVNPLRLTSALQEAGWRQIGGRRHVYTRFAPPGEASDRRGGLIVPLDTAAPEFHDDISAVIAELSSPRYADLWQRIILPRLAVGNADQFRFRKESSAPSGLIAWRLGRRLVESATDALIAGAKAFVEPGRKYYSNSHGQFANRYLDTVLMGQSGAGSYVVTALAPASATVPLKGGRAEGFGLVGVDIASARTITEAVSTAIEATVEALAHQRSTGSFNAFDARVDDGVSYEMATALKGVTKDADEAEITIEWDSAVSESPIPNKVFAFQGGDAAVLDTVAARFAAAEPEERVTLVGRVHLLTKKEAGGPGVFGIETLGRQSRKVRVRLSDTDDYHKAVVAHDDDRAIRVTGGLTREGQMSWLYNARVLGVLGNYIELQESLKSTGDSTDQTSLFGDA